MGLWLDGFLLLLLVSIASSNSIVILYWRRWFDRDGFGGMIVLLFSYLWRGRFNLFLC